MNENDSIIITKANYPTINDLIKDLEDHRDYTVQEAIFTCKGENKEVKINYNFKYQGIFSIYAQEIDTDENNTIKTNKEYHNEHTRILSQILKYYNVLTEYRGTEIIQEQEEFKEREFKNVTRIMQRLGIEPRKKRLIGTVYMFLGTKLMAKKLAHTLSAYEEAGEYTEIEKIILKK